MDASEQVAALLQARDARRSAAVGNYLATIAATSRMVDQLCELHSELEPDDRLRQVLHALGFCWQQVESELLSAAKSRRN